MPSSVYFIIITLDNQKHIQSLVDRFVPLRARLAVLSRLALQLVPQVPSTAARDVEFVGIVVDMQSKNAIIHDSSNNFSITFTFTFTFTSKNFFIYITKYENASTPFEDKQLYDLKSFVPI
jgi:hypothetical protein